MTSTDQITELSERIVDEFHPRRIVLFGSYAWGNPNPDSDVDLLIIMPFEGKPVGKSVEMRLKVRPRFPVDLLVRTPEKIRERLAMGDTFIRDILEQGKVLYEADAESACIDRLSCSLLTTTHVTSSTTSGLPVKTL
ncbi:MAG TPA: nucleotidyltransferase domain-containing protein [Anaerolineae bacterium]|nr:nucleotidyltransferase domain-containing protein [Anaerolineae bacterium]